jgi:hypothetical protein
MLLPGEAPVEGLADGAELLAFAGTITEADALDDGGLDSGTLLGGGVKVPLLVMFLVWFETRKPANQNHGLSKPKQTKVMVLRWFWFWFWSEACETKTNGLNHGFQHIKFASAVQTKPGIQFIHLPEQRHLPAQLLYAEALWCLCQLSRGID